MITTTSEITVRPVQQMGGDHMVMAAMKVSTSGVDAFKYADPKNATGLAGRIEAMMKERHGGVFEHCAMTFFVHAPDFVWRQWNRHRIGMSYNLESGRYHELKPLFWVPRLSRPMVPDDGHKPIRPKFKPASEDVAVRVCDVLKRSYEGAWSAYREILAAGVCSEVARSVLPCAIYVAGWVTTNPRALMHFLDLRTRDDRAARKSYPQAEIEEAARAAEDVFRQGWPLTHAAFCKHGRVAP